MSRYISKLEEFTHLLRTINVAFEEQMNKKKYDNKEHVCFSCGGLLKVTCSEKYMNEAQQFTFKGCKIVIFQRMKSVVFASL